MVISNSTTKRGIMNGMVARTNFSKGIFPTLTKTNRTTPKGGVKRPIMRFNTMRTPKWTVSIPTFCATGIRIGVRIRIATTGSIKHPTHKRKRLRSRGIINGFWLTSEMASANRIGMPDRISSKP